MVGSMDEVGHICPAILSCELLWQLCRTQELPLLTSSSFITPHSNGIFLSVFRHIHNSLVWRPDSPMSVRANTHVSLWICVGHLSAAGEPLVQAILKLCECLGIKLPSHHTHMHTHPHTRTHTHKGLSVLLPKCITVSFPRTWRDRCERLQAVSGIGGDNVNSQECDPHHSHWFRRGVWRGERSPAALQQKKWNVIPVTIKPYLRCLPQPIAIVCQLPRRVMGAFSLTSDLCLLTRLPRAHKHRAWRVLSNTR